MAQQKIILSLEGNIGSGKSTLLKAFKDTKSFEFDIIPEPVGEWSLPNLPGGKSMLEAFYEDKAGNGFAFQMYAMLTRYRLMKLALLKSGRSVIITERSSWSDYELFGTMMYDLGMFTDADWLAYTAWMEETTSSSPSGPSGIIYMRTSPKACMDRIRGRARPGEENISAAYIKTLHDRHEEFIAVQKDKGVSVLVVDADALCIGGEKYMTETVDRIVEWTTALLSGNPQKNN